MKEAASLKKYDLFTDSRDLLSQSSQSSLSSPSVSAPNSPAAALASPIKTSTELQAPSPLSGEGLPSTPEKEEQQEKVNSEQRNKMDEAPRGAAEQHEAAQNVSPEGGAHKAVKAEAGGPVQTHQSQTPEVAAPLTVVQEEVLSVITQRAEPAGSLPDVGNRKTEVVAAQEDAAGPAEGAASQTQTHRPSWDIKTEAPSSVQTPADLKHEAAGPASVSDASSLDASAGSKLPTSDLESTEDVHATQSSEEDGSTTSDILEDEANLSKLPVRSDDPAEDRTTSDKPAARAEAASEGIEAGASAEPSAKAAEAPTSPSNQETPSDPDALPPDSIKEIRNLVVEVIEVEELLQCYPDGVPKEE